MAVGIDHGSTVPGAGRTGAPWRPVAQIAGPTRRRLDWLAANTLFVMLLCRTCRPPCLPGRASALLALVATFVALTCARAGAEDLDLWFTIELAGQKAGWQRLTVTTENDQITTTTHVHMTIRRGQDTATVTFAGEFVETAAGEPVRMRRRGDSGRTPMISEYTFDNETIRVVSRPAGDGGEAGDRGTAQESEAALPEGSWLAPAAARQYVAQRLEAGADRITVRTMDPSLGPQAITVSRQVIEKTRAEVGPPDDRREIDVWRCSVRQSFAEDLHTVEYLDARGIPVVTETKLGGLNMRFALSDQETAQRAAPAPEMLVSVLVRPDQPIARPRQTVEAVYTVRTPQGALPELPGAGGQRFERLGDQVARLRVSAVNHAPAGEVDTGPLLASSHTLDTGDDVLKRLARRATAAAGDSAPARAEAMRRFVHQHVRTKNLDVVFARASEVARSQEGDCTEHATLLAALLRIEGIPSRVVSGLIYTEQFAGEKNIFVYHMWTQALLEIDGQQRWVDLDATLGGRAFDAAHIAVSTSDLAGETGPLDAMLVIAQLMGNLEITVEEVR